MADVDISALGVSEFLVTHNGISALGVSYTLNPLSRLTSSSSGPVIDLNFATGVYSGGALTDNLSNSNASGGYVTNADGTLTWVAANTLRIGVGTGLLVEESRTNVCQYSNNLTGAAWAAQSGLTSRTANAAVAPDGTTTASNMLEDSSTGAHAVVQGSGGSCPQPITAGAAFTWSAYVKQGTGSVRRGIFVEILDDATDTNGLNVEFDFQTGTVIGHGLSGTGTYISASMTALANGWYRIVITGILDATHTSMDHWIYMENALGFVSYTGDGTGSLYVWGVQVEVGSFATSPILTTSAAATRNADAVTLIGTAKTLYLNPPFSVLVIGSGTPNYATSGGFLESDAGGNESIIYPGGADNLLRSYVQATGVSIALGSGLWTGQVKAAFGTDSNGRSFVGNNGTVATDNKATQPGTYKAPQLGQNSSAYYDGYIQRLAVWNTRLPDAQLQALTA